MITSPLDSIALIMIPAEAGWLKAVTASNSGKTTNRPPRRVATLHISSVALMIFPFDGLSFRKGSEMRTPFTNRKLSDSYVFLPSVGLQLLHSRDFRLNSTFRKNGKIGKMRSIGKMVVIDSIYKTRLLNFSKFPA